MNTSTKNIILIGLFSIAALLIYKTDNSALNIFSNSDFKFGNCELCNRGECKSTELWKGFSVLDQGIQIYMSGGKSADKIIAIPQNIDVKCVIAKHKNFAFDCESSKYSLDRYSAVSITFDGKDKFQWRNSEVENGNLISDSNLICRVK